MNWFKFNYFNHPFQKDSQLYHFFTTNLISKSIKTFIESFVKQPLNFRRTEYKNWKKINCQYYSNWMSSTIKLNLQVAPAAAAAPLPAPSACWKRIYPVLVLFYSSFPPLFEYLKFGCWLPPDLQNPIN